MGAALLAHPPEGLQREEGRGVLEQAMSELAMLLGPLHPDVRALAARLGAAKSQRVGGQGARRSPDERVSRGASLGASCLPGPLFLLPTGVALGLTLQ